MTQWRNTKKWEMAAAGTAGIASFFTVESQKKWLRSPSPDRSLMSEGKKICDVGLVLWISDISHVFLIPLSFIY